MPNRPVEIKAGQVWESDTVTRCIVRITVKGEIHFIYSRTKCISKASRWNECYTEPATFQRWAATAKLVKEAENGR